MSDESNKNKFVLGFVMGSSIATITAMIFHPRSGTYTKDLVRKTSQALLQMGNDFASTLPIHGEQLSSVAINKCQRNWQRLQVSIRTGIEASKVD